VNITDTPIAGSDQVLVAMACACWHTDAGRIRQWGREVSAVMISRRIPDSSVPLSLLADHPDVQFGFYRPGIVTCDAEMHRRRRSEE
jgi:hypothetical protein